MNLDQKRMAVFGSAYVHPTANIYGDVRLGQLCSVWCNAVIRAETGFVSVGPGTNVQDFAMIHVGLQNSTIVGANCSITHRATLHGCTIDDNVLVGIGATIMDGCHIGENSVVAGHTFLKEGTIIPANSIVMGIPGTVTKHRNSSVANRLNAFIYRRNAEAYAKGNYRLWESPQFTAEYAREKLRLED